MTVLGLGEFNELSNKEINIDNLPLTKQAVFLYLNVVVVVARVEQAQASLQGMPLDEKI